jgi:hypothetical protein
MKSICSMFIFVFVISYMIYPPKYVFAAGESEPNNTIAQANPINVGLGNAITATLTSNDDDYYQFNTIAGRTYVIETFNIQGQIGGVATGLWLYNSAGTLVKDDKYGSAGVGDADASIVLKSVDNAVYYIKVADREMSTWAGTYSLRLLAKYDEPGASWDEHNQYEPNNSIYLANKIDVGLHNFVTRTLFDNRSLMTNTSDYDYYYFSAVAGNSYVIETFNIQGQRNSKATGLWLYNSAGTLITDDAPGIDGNDDANARIILKATGNDIYYIGVGKSSFTTHWYGTYSLRILPKHNESGADRDASGEPNNVLVLAEPMNIGVANAVKRTLSNNTSVATSGSDVDFYTFQAAANTTYNIQIFDATKQNNTWATGLRLYNDQGSIVQNDDTGTLSGYINAEIVVKITTPGIYYVRVSSSSFATWYGNYSLRICANSCTTRTYAPFVRK